MTAIQLSEVLYYFHNKNLHETPRDFDNSGIILVTYVTEVALATFM